MTWIGVGCLTWKTLCLLSHLADQSHCSSICSTDLPDYDITTNHSSLSLIIPCHLLNLLGQLSAWTPFLRAQGCPQETVSISKHTEWSSSPSAPVLGAYLWWLQPMAANQMSWTLAMDLPLLGHGTQPLHFMNTIALGHHDEDSQRGRERRHLPEGGIVRHTK